MSLGGAEPDVLLAVPMAGDEPVVVKVDPVAAAEQARSVPGDHHSVAVRLVSEDLRVLAPAKAPGRPRE